jgi:transposase
MSKMPFLLPDLDALDPAALKAMICLQHAELISHKSQIEHLELLIAKLRRMQFGRSSEKVERQIEQLELKLEELEANRAELAPELPAEPAVLDRSPASRKRRSLPDHLPREVHTHLPSEESCSDCGGALKKLGEDISEMLEYLPASFKVIRHIRPRMCCAGCDRIVQAPAPSRPIDRGLAGPGLLAHVLTAKFCDHLPLYRQSEIYAREGVDLDRSTLAKWVGESSSLLAPLVEVLRRYVLSADKLHGDDTPVPVLAPGTGKTKTGRLWTYVRDDRPSASLDAPAVWFAYSPDRKGEHPQRHLAHFRGILQADAYAGFNKLYEDGLIQEAPCMAHIRRKFFDLMEAHRSPVATEAVERIALLYAIEKEIRGRSRDERRRVRTHAPGHWSSPCTSGSRHRSPRSHASPIRLRRSTTPSRSGTRWCATWTMAASRSITPQPNGPCVGLPSVAATISSRARIAEENVPPSSTPSSVRPSSTASIPKPICGMC